VPSVPSVPPPVAPPASASSLRSADEPAKPSLYNDGRGPRDWARELRERTKAARVADEAPSPRGWDAPPARGGEASTRALEPGSALDAPSASDDSRTPSLLDTPRARELACLQPRRDVRDVQPSFGFDAPPALPDEADPVADAPADAPPQLAALLPGFASLPRAALVDAPASQYFAQLRYLGQLDLTYLACEGDGELVLIDQHAAHERVAYERLRARHAGGELRVAVQAMLFPVELEATPAQLALVARVGALLAQVGFDVAPTGADRLALKAVPAGIRHGDPAQLLRAMLQEWAEDGAPSEAERLEALLGEIACHSVVRAGDRLTPGEAESLVRSLDGVDLTLPAPHGKAVMLRLPLTEIGRRFGR